jgi:hypothetical protein
VFEGKLAHLALDPRTVDGDGPDCRTERGHDSGDDPVVERDAPNLGKDGLLPGLGRNSSPAAPALARLDMELSVLSVRGPSSSSRR